jgi:DNA mismatch repair protein MutS2
LKKVSGRLEKLATETREAGAPDEKIPRDKLKSGDRVYLIPLQKKGRLTTDPMEGRVEVEVGQARISAGLEDVIGIGGEEPLDKFKIKREKQFISTDFNPPPNISSELNIRGMRVEEALEKLDKFIDTIYGGGWAGCRILHGKGTGTLRQAVREVLRSTPYVQGFDDAQDNEGGSGVTVVRFSGR